MKGEINHSILFLKDWIIHLRIIILLYITLIISNPLHAGPDNIAHLSRASAASFVKDENSPQKVVDGLIQIPGKGEWISNSGMTSWGYINYPWIRLDWDRPVVINKVIIYDSASEKTHIAGGILNFSDGSREPVLLIPNDGSPKVVTFTARKVEWLRFEVTDADGANVGLSEIEVFPAPDDYKDYVSWVDPYVESAPGTQLRQETRYR